MIKKIFIYIFFICLCLISLQTITAANLTVHPGESLQNSVNKAVNGDNIIVYDNNAPYTYNENIIINKKISIKAIGNVTIQAANSGSPIFTINQNGAGSTIQNFRLSNSNYCIVVSNTKDCTLLGNTITGASLVGIQFYGNINNTKVQDNTIIGFDPTRGNGISFEGGNCTYNNITGNYIENFFHGILFNDKSENNIIKNNIVKCTGYNGVGIYATENSRYMQIIGNTITGAEDGIAVQQIGTNTPINYYISGNTVTGNKNGFWLCLSNSTISNNYAAQNTVSGIDITGRYNTINNNTATNNGICGICLGEFAAADYNTLNGNTLTYNEAGINSASNYSTFSNNKLSNNIKNGLIITGSGCNVTGNSMFHNQESGILITGINNIVTGNRLEQNLYGAIFNNRDAAIFNLNSVVGNTYQVYSADTVGSINALNNWWGSNSNPTSIYGLFNLNPWIVLRINSNNPIGSLSTITADLTKNSNGEDTTSLYPVKYIPDGITVNFSCDSMGIINPTVKTTVNGVSTTTFTGYSPGSSLVTARVDNQSVSTDITITQTQATATGVVVNPASGFKGDIINLTATLKDKSNNQPLAGKNVRFKVSGNIVGTAITNSQGIAILHYKLTQNTGTYTVVAEFVPDSSYFGSSNTNSLQVKLTTTVSPTAGIYNSTKTVSLNLNGPGTIYYTLNGTNPTTTSSKYISPIIITKTTILKYILVDLLGKKSSIYTYIYTIDKTSPTAYVAPSGSCYNISKRIYLKMSELGTIYYTLNGTKPSLSSTKYTASFIVTRTTILKFFARDKSGNLSPLYTKKYTIDRTTPRVSSSTPGNMQIGFSRTATLAIKFSENIFKSSYFTSIKLKDIITGSYITIIRYIKGNTLYINPTRTRSSCRWYQVIIPKSAIQDYAGNKLLETYLLRFKTGI